MRAPSLPASEPPTAPVETFPRGIHNAYWFAIFNALSFQIILSSPMVLYARSLGASATVLGIIAGMMPLLVIFQIPAASYIERIGYRRFVYAGWGTRVLFIFGMALVPWTGFFLDAGTQLALLLTLLFCFNLSRGISSCAWLPWITLLVPENLRGRYLARDAACTNLASFAAFLIAAACLVGAPRPWQFSVVFAFSAVMGAISLMFLKRIPDVPVPESARTADTGVPWLAMLRYAPFQKLLREVVFWAVAQGGISTFSVVFLKNQVGLSEGTILLVTSTAFLGGWSSLYVLGARLDRLGSRPVLGFALTAWLAVIAGWSALAGNVVSATLAGVVILQFFMGLLAALVQMANTRLAMAVIPPMGRNHFFALYSVISNLVLGLAPIGWGLLIDLVGGWQTRALGVEWNRFTVFFAAAGLVFVGALEMARRLEEPKAASMETLLREILIESPQRFWLRLWPRG